ncbi:MAG: class I SAM-dependent methyltransferase [Verrucomicrobiales bacterium]
MANQHETVRTDRACPLTGSYEAMVVSRRAREGHPLRNVMSTSSGLVYVDPLPVEDLAQYYREEYRVSYKKTVVPRRRHVFRAAKVALMRLGHCEGLVRPGMKSLDVGAGGGEWVYLMRRLGCDAVGVEPNEGYGSFARQQYDVEVFLGMYRDAVFQRGSFDLVTLFQVLEHLAEPVEDLRAIADYLKPGGLFVIEVPDILFPGMHFRHKWHDGHLYGFDARTLEAVANRAGLRTVSIKTLPGNIFAVFEKVERGDDEFFSLEGHFEEAREALFGGRRKYWALPETYLKAPRRIFKTVRERAVSRMIAEPRKILDHVYNAAAPEKDEASDT